MNRGSENVQFDIVDLELLVFAFLASIEKLIAECGALVCLTSVQCVIDPDGRPITNAVKQVRSYPSPPIVKYSTSPRR